MSDVQTIIVLLSLAGLVSSVLIELARERREDRLWREHLSRLEEDAC
ncbi:hypothetical protein [Desulfarculus baarsii]